jgi:hypothetical protein
MDKKEENLLLGQSAFDLLKEAFVKVCTESTSHGLPNIFKTKNWIIQCVWLVLFLGGSSAALYCRNISIFSPCHYSTEFLENNKSYFLNQIFLKDTIISIMEYLTYPVSVSVETVYESPTNFPAVTICKIL